MYRVSGLSAIVPYEVVKETHKTITFVKNGRNQQESKHAEFHDWFQTESEAVEHIRATASDRIEHLTRQIEQYQRVIDNLPKTTNHD